MSELKEKKFKIYRSSIVSGETTGDLAEQIESLEVVRLSDAEEEREKIQKLSDSWKGLNEVNVKGKKINADKIVELQKENKELRERCLLLLNAALSELKADRLHGTMEVLTNSISEFEHLNK